MKKLVILLVLFVMLSACSSPVSGNGVPTSFVITAEESTVIPDDVGTSSISTPEILPVVPTELKYRLLEEFPDFFFCDPDFYPVARDDEQAIAIERFPELQADQNEFPIILSHLGLSEGTNFNDEQKLSIYREHKKLNAIYFEQVGDQYRFQIQTGLEGQQGTAITGTINHQGSIAILDKQESFPNCPICLAAGSLIDTPLGAVPVEKLQLGDPVWTANEAGERIAVSILRVGNTRAPASHQMIHVTLDDGRELWVSPGHHTSDGRVFANLQLGNVLDGARIVGLETVQYHNWFTFDLLPSGNTGFYWANGILVDSTLKK